MKHSITFVAAIIALTTALASADVLKRDFEAEGVGSPPAGFEFARTGGGADGKWVVRVEKGATTNHVLVQESADRTDYRFPVAVLKEGAQKDLVLSVRARPLSGQVDQGFGLVWRYKDVNNYYVTRCNADEDNCTIYHTVGGQRRAFQSQNVKVAKNTWHTVKVEVTGNHFVVTYDGTRSSTQRTTRSRTRARSDSGRRRTPSSSSTISRSRVAETSWLYSDTDHR